MIIGDSTIRGIGPHMIRASMDWEFGNGGHREAPQIGAFRTFGKSTHGMRLRDHFHQFTAHRISGAEDIVLFKMQLEYADLLQIAYEKIEDGKPDSTRVSTTW